MRDSPDNAITLVDTETTIQGSLQDGEVQENEGVQIVVRHRKRKTAWEKADNIAKALDVVNNKTITLTGPTGTGTIQYTVYSVTRVSGPLSIGKEEETNRRLFTINVRAAIVQTT
jgi:hypothetical protein